MEEDSILGADCPLPPARLFERLSQVPRYTWDQSFQPFHSTYDHWHVVGLLHNPGDLDTPQTGNSSSSFSNALASASSRSSPRLGSRPHFRQHWSSISGASTDSEFSSTVREAEPWTSIMARVSTHVVRLEREYKTIKTIVKDCDPTCEHILRPLDMFKLPATAQDSSPMLVCIYETAGRNYLREVLNFGPAFFGAKQRKLSAQSLDEPLSLQAFLDFAVGACSCLELLHHGVSRIHGEIRQDSFHWNRETNIVRLINIGNGPRAFENLLSSNGWAMMSKERGAINKLAYIAPEQTGRLAFEPDSRTDIYSLGMLFYTLLTGRPGIDADTPIDVIQKVLSTRLDTLKTKRLDLPDAISDVVQKMTQKQMDERYNSVSGLKFDLMEIQRLLGEGDTVKMSEYVVGQRDVSSFFILPSRIVGHHVEHDRITRIIEKLHRRHTNYARKAGQSNLMYSTTSASSISESFADGMDAPDASDTSSSFGVRESRSNSTTIGLDSNLPVGRPNLFLGGRGITEPRNGSFDGSDRDSQFSGPFATTVTDSLGPMGRINRRTGYKPKRRSKTEVILLTGPQGSGKSTVVKSVQPSARKFGYYASSRFDEARPNPFEPLLKVMASLFRQIFSEKDVSTAYHEMVRSHVRPVWHVLHTILDLPDTLLDHAQPPRRVMHSGDSLRSDQPNLDTRSVVNAVKGANGTNRDSNDFLRGPASTKSIRLINTYVDVLRLLCSNKVICLALDDFHSADDESLDLIDNIIRARISVVFLLVRRNDDGSESSDRALGDHEHVSLVELANLKEKHVFEYVSTTMSRPVEEILPLAAAVYEKSAGNPYLMKELLQTLYQRNCLWYDWRTTGWQFDLDKVFNELTAEDQQGGDFILRKIRELPKAASCVLVWGSLIGNTFSFKLIQKVMSGDCFPKAMIREAAEISTATAAENTRVTFARHSQDDLLDALNLLLNTGCIISGENDDEYSFAHNRYLNAAQEYASLSGKVKEMHFVIAQTMLPYLSLCRYSLYPLARHICLAEDLVRKRVKTRARHRDVLWRAAGKARETGAKATALWYYKTCVNLLQDNPWTAGPDSFYDETLQLYINLAEILYEHGDLTEAEALLDSTFAHSKCSADKTRSHLLHAKILNKQAHYEQAFESLQSCLTDLGQELPDKSYEELDKDFHELTARLEKIDVDELLARPLSEQKNVIASGTIFSEATSTTYWYDARRWLFLVMAWVKYNLDNGLTVQVGLSFNMLGSAAISRYNDLELGHKYADIASSFYAKFDDPFTQGRGWVLYSMFLAHTRLSVRNILPILENALDFSLASGDRAVSILNLGCMAATRFWAGQDLAEIEAFCQFSPEEFDKWEFDLRGGTILIAIRQLCRALQGKTRIDSVDTLLDDESCSKKAWYALCEKNKMCMVRATDLWKCLTAPAFYIFGYHDKLIEAGRELVITTIDDMYSNRAAAQLRFYLAMSLLAVSKNETQERKKEICDEVQALRDSIACWATVNDVNYYAMLKLIDAEVNDVNGQYDQVINNLEAVIDHCQIHGFALEEAIAVEIGAEFLAARGAKRPAKVMIQEAIAAWNRINAVAKGAQLAEKHEWLIKTATTSRMQDAITQTDTLASLVGNDDPGLHTQRDYTSKWADPGIGTPGREISEQEIPGMGLDVLDLTSILEFSKVISSQLQIDKLLDKMIEVILESVGGQAEFCAIVIDSEEYGWAVAATGDHDNGTKTYPDGIPFQDVDDVVAQQITHYILRTRETIVVPNVLEDERFGNVSEAYLKRNPKGRSIICLPIIQSDHLMGVVHLEGRPSAFTQRNMIVLTLLTNHVAIALGNALLYRKVRKVSAANAAMVESQKRALATAREAELKAKEAEAEAMHNVKLKDEAMKSKSIFLANVSHELRTPLNGVIGMSELLKGTQLTKDQEGYADSIRVCADTLLTVINDILDFSKLEAGKMQLFAVPLNLKETITEVVRALAYTNQEHGLETIEDLELDDSLVLGDPVRLHQLLMNLLSNAYKFTPKGSVTVKARKVAETKEKVKHIFSVADTGIGITKEQLSRLFQPFSQADSSTARSYGGSGLGLSICKAMIENVLGGKIWIESKPGVGTTVFFQLTFQKAPKDSSATVDMKISAKDPDPMANWSRSSAPKEEAKASFCDLSKIPRNELRVCIAEDNLINRKIALSFTNKLGVGKVEAYEDGKLAYEALQRASKEDEPYHLVLMDVQMPVLDGYNATKAIRKDPDPRVREVLIIAMTASAIRGDREKCLEAGMNDYLAKPVRQAALKAMLDEYLNNTKSAQQVISATPTSQPTPGDKVNQETARVPNKAAATVVNGEKKEADTTTAKAPNGVKGAGKQKDEEAKESSSEGTATESSATPVEHTPAKPRRKRIPIKGSTRKMSSSSESKKPNGEAPADGTKDPDRTDSSSPPSGVVEQDLLGKISTDVLSSPDNGPTKEELDGMLSRTVTRQKYTDKGNQHEEAGSKA